MNRAILTASLLAAVIVLALSGPRDISAQAGCTPHSIMVPTLQVLADPGRPGDYVATLAQGDVVCVLDGSVVGPQRLGRISIRILPGGGTEPLNGWASTMFMAVTEGFVAGTNPSTSNPAPPPETEEPPRPEETATPNVEEALAEGELRFDQPIPYGPSVTRGKSIAEIIEGTPEFPPIADLPETLWKKPCKTCHSWNKELLCEQGKSYIPKAEAVFRHQHPMGGPFKLALMRWANSGCN